MVFEKATLFRLAKYFPNRENWILKSKTSTWRTCHKAIDTLSLINYWTDSFFTIGLRPGKTTKFLSLDIDKNSQYHYFQDKSAIRDIIKTVEKNLGLSRHLIIQSSSSRGVHIYFPLYNEVDSELLAQNTYDALSSNGYEIKPGQLEIFPNRRTNTTAHFNGLRLPFQEDSFLLNEKFHIVENLNGNEVCEAWEMAAGINSRSLSLKVVTSQNTTSNVVKITFEKKQVVEIRRQQYVAPTGDIPSWLREFPQTVPGMMKHLQTIADTGFTATGQTNTLVMTCARLFFILGGIDKIDTIGNFIRNLKGFEEFCNHKKDLEEKIKNTIKNIIDFGKYKPIKYTKTLKIYSERLFSLVDKVLRKRQNFISNKKEDVISRLKESCKVLMCENKTYENKTLFLKRLAEVSGASMTTLLKYWDEIEEFYNRCNRLPSKGLSTINNLLLNRMCYDIKYIIYLEYYIYIYKLLLKIYLYKFNIKNNKYKNKNNIINFKTMTERKLTLEDLQKQAQKLVREEKDYKIQEIKNHIAQEKQKEDYEKYGSVIFEDKDEIVNDIVNKYLKRKIS